MNRLPILLLTILGMVVGFWLPDLDLRLGLFGLLIHRSIITHGCIIPVLCFSSISKRGLDLLRPLAAGVSIAMATHLCFDLFPARWTGFALITIPLYGRTTSLFSQFWLALSIVICLYLVLRWIDNVYTLTISGLCLVSGFALAVQGTVYARLLPLFALLIAGGIALWLTLPSNLYLRHVYERVKPSPRP